MLHLLGRLAAAKAAVKMVKHQADNVTGSIDKRRRRRNRRSRAKTLPMAAAGVAGMYFFDPANGYDRRQAIKDKVSSLITRKKSLAENKAADLREANNKTTRLVTDKLDKQQPVHQ